MFLVFAVVRVIMIEYTINMINTQHVDNFNLCCVSVGKTPQNRNKFGLKVSLCQKLSIVILCNKNEI